MPLTDQSDLDALGRIARTTMCAAFAEAGGDLEDWDGLTDWERDVWRQVAEAVRAAVLAPPVTQQEAADGAS